jgi:hypothetical protein
MRLNFKKLTSFQEQSIPEASELAGFSALVNALSIDVPVRRPSCVSEKHIRGTNGLRFWSNAMSDLLDP